MAIKKSDDMSDHDLLIRIDERQDSMNDKLDEHLKQHFLVRIAAYGAFFTAVGAVVAAVFI